MQRACVERLPDGRLHLHHGPIDLITTIEGPGAAKAEVALFDRFEHVLVDLVEELPVLRASADQSNPIKGIVAGRMMAAVHAFLPEFITPMAAVAGAVADEMIATIRNSGGVSKAVVNNGGDVAFHLGPGEQTTAVIAGLGASMTLTAAMPWRGVATSGWQGRSWSLGIADAVTVVARSAAAADAAATMIGNQVTLPDHPAVTLSPAETVTSETDLRGQRVTTDVGPLSAKDIDQALDNGAAYAADLLRRGLIGGAVLFLQGEARQVGDQVCRVLPQHREKIHA